MCLLLSMITVQSDQKCKFKFKYCFCNLKFRLNIQTMTIMRGHLLHFETRIFQLCLLQMTVEEA